MTAPAPDALAQVRALRRFAALSGHFDPGAALGAIPGLGPADTDRLVTLAAQLASACDTTPGDRTSSWLMRGPERRWELDQLAGPAAVRDAVDWRRRSGPAGDDTLDLLDALVGEGRLTDEEVQRRVDQGGPRRDLERVAVALDRAGPPAPAWPRLEAVRTALARLDAEGRGQGLLGDGFVGRADELAAIADWLAGPATQVPVRALFVAGLAGIGKSTLLEEAVRAARTDARRWIPVRLDFDRAGLDIQDQVGLTVEFARQVAAEVGEQAQDLREARLDAAGGAPGSAPAVKGEARERVPVPLAGAVAGHVQRAGRPVLLVLDTLEVLRGRGETHPARLFDWVDQLVAFGIAPLAVLAAGRGDALDGASGRVGRRVDLAELDDASAALALTRLGVPADSAAAVLAVAGGNPLVLRLAAAVTREVGPAGLRRVAQRRSLAAAYLYRFLLSRIPDPTLRALAHPGLIVRRISAEVIAEVLAPALRLGRLDPPRAVSLFEALSQQHWLVQADPTAPGFVSHRGDIRRVLVRLLYDSSPARCAAIDRAAAAWFAARPEPWCAVEAAYHRLQLLRRDPAPPAVDPAALRRLDEDALAELPQRAQDLVRRVRGERTSLARGRTEPGAEVPPGAARELEAILARGDWAEGEYVYDRAYRGSVFDARSREADAARAFLWRSGQWQEARRLLDERDRLLPDDRDLAGLPAQLTASRLEMRAELAFDRLRRRLSTDPELGGRAAEVAFCGLQGELSDGALGFALLRAGLPRPVTSWRGFAGVAAAAARWLPAAGLGDTGPALAAAADRLGRRLGRPTAPADGAAATARLLAVLTPYADLAVTLARIRGDGRIEEHAAAVDRRLAELGALAPVGSPPWAPAPQPAQPLDALTGLGLFAEWAGAAAFTLRDADLALLARSAERWRRAAAGQWPYDEPPAAWRSWDRPLDVTLADRLSTLESGTDPVGAAGRQLAAWSGPDPADSVPLPVAIERRMPATLAAGRSALPAGAAGAARVLLRRHLPSAFVPPVAVLLAHRKL